MNGYRELSGSIRYFFFFWILIFSFPANAELSSIKKNGPRINRNYDIDCTSPSTYLSSIRAIRSSVAHQYRSLSGQVFPIYQLRASPPSEAFTVTLTNIDRAAANIRFLVMPNNLYIEGYVARDWAGNEQLVRLNGVAQSVGIMVDGINGAADVTTDGNYNTLPSRENLIINRQSLITAANTLNSSYITSESGRGLNDNQRRSLLYFISIISESIRFTNLAESFASIFGYDYSYGMMPEYRFTSGDIEQTLSWSDISSTVEPLEVRNGTVVNLRWTSYSSLVQLFAILAVANAPNPNNPCSRSTGSRYVISDPKQCLLGPGLSWKGDQIWEKGVLYGILLPILGLLDE